MYIIFSLYRWCYGLFDRKEWIRSSKPYPLSISLRQLQDLLKNTRAIDVDSFNMAVRVNATDDIQWAKDTPYHYMDLRFSVSY